MSALSSIPSAIMPRTSSADQGLVEKAVDKLKMHTTLTVVDAMHLAGFTEDERKDKNIQRLVLRRLPGKGKHAYLSMMASTDSGRDGGPVSDIGTGASNIMSPLTDPTFSTPTSSDIISSRQQIKRSRLTSKQAQDKRVLDLQHAINYKSAFKEATIMYSEERTKEDWQRHQRTEKNSV